MKTEAKATARARKRAAKEVRPADQPRVRRPNLPRAQPIRLFSGMFGAPAPAAPLDGAPAASRSPRQGVKSDSDSVARGVNAGYRVIEEYLRQGQELARSVWPGAPSAPIDGPPVMNLTDRMLRSASDLAGLFSEFLQTFSLPGTLPPPGSQPIPEFGLQASAKPGPSASSVSPKAGQSSSDSRPASKTPPSAGRDDGPAPLSMDVESKRRIEITLDLKPGSWKETLEVYDLRSATRSTPPLRGVTLSIRGGGERRVLVRARIPDDQQPGTYSGLVVDQRTNVPRGTLWVRVFASSKKK